MRMNMHLNVMKKENGQFNLLIINHLKRFLMEKEKYTVYHITQKDGTKKPIRRKIRDEKAWLRSYQLTLMKRSISVEVCFTANYDELGMLRYLIESKLNNWGGYNFDQLIKAIDEAREMADHVAEKEYRGGGYWDWISKYK